MDRQLHRLARSRHRIWVFITTAKRILQRTAGDAEICIAVLDGPVDLTHPCFNKAKITKLETLVSDLSNEGPTAHHGTYVASLIFGQHASPIHGISPGCRGLIIPVFEVGLMIQLFPVRRSTSLMQSYKPLNTKSPGHKHKWW